MERFFRLIKQKGNLFLGCCFVLFLLIDATFVFGATINIPVNTSNWTKIKDGAWEDTAGGLRVYGTGHRVGNGALSNDLFDFRNVSDVYVKWQARGGDNYVQYYVAFGVTEDRELGRCYFTTDHSFLGSQVMDDDKWYFTSLHINGDGSYTVITAENNYDDAGGTVVQNLSYPPSDLNLFSSAGIFAGLGDNYAGTAASLLLGEVIVVGDVLPFFTETWTEKTFADFGDGRFDPGGNIFASSDGGLKITGQQWDLNNDGFLDIVFSNADDGTSYNINSYIYWGSADGFSGDNKTKLPTHYARGNSIADLNGDGFMDIVFSNTSDGTSNEINSVIYWGSGSGFSSDNKTELPTHNAIGNSIADLNNDGFLDIVFSSYGNSHIYWGSVSGFSSDNKTDLPAHALPASNSIADLNGDGFLDIVFSNNNYGGSANVNSYIYWGSVSGFSSDNKTELPTHYGNGNSIADLNGDGFLDIIFSNFGDGTSYNINSYIYWGSVSGFSIGNKTELPTDGAAGSNSIADLNGDGFLDIVFSNCFNGASFNTNSYIYWGSVSGFSSDSKTELPTHGVHGNTIADLNGDGFLDIIFSNFGDGTSYNINSYIYWGSVSGFSSDSKTELPTHGAERNATKDLGDIYNRGAEIFYTSSAYDTGNFSNFGELAFLADTPANTSVAFQIRTAKTESELVMAEWFGPTDASDRYAVSGAPINPIHYGDRWIQYRAFFGLSEPLGLATPSLEEVSISFSPFPVITSVSPDFGYVTGGTEITITGSNFRQGAIVRIGANALTDVTVESDGLITGKTPTGVVGLHDVVVINPDGTSAFLKNGYAYMPLDYKPIQFTLKLFKGINLISIPVKLEGWRMSDLAEHIGKDSVSMIIRYDYTQGKFISYLPTFPDDSPANASVQCGAGYIVVMKVEKQVGFEGNYCESEIAAPSLMPLMSSSNEQSTSIFVVTGNVRREGAGRLLRGVYAEERGSRNDIALNGVAVKIRNLRTGQMIEDITGVLAGYGNYIATFVASSEEFMTRATDEIEITAMDKDNRFVITPVTHTLTTRDISDFVLVMPLRLSLPKKSALLQNYPNPFNPETWLPYQLAADAPTNIAIYNVKGELVRLLNLGTKQAGTYIDKSRAAYWDGRDDSGQRVASGMYFYTLQAGEYRATRRLLIVK